MIGGLIQNFLNQTFINHGLFTGSTARVVKHGQRRKVEGLVLSGPRVQISSLAPLISSKSDLCESLCSVSPFRICSCPCGLRCSRGQVGDAVTGIPYHDPRSNCSGQEPAPSWGYLSLAAPFSTLNSAMRPFTNVILGALWPTSASVTTGTSRCLRHDSTRSQYPISPW